MSSGRRRRAAFFDMDRTLVRANTGRLYVRWQMSRGEADARDLVRVMAWIAQYSLGVADTTEITRAVLGTLRGKHEHELERDCRAWFAQVVRPHVSTHARREVDRRRAMGDLLVVLSASTPYVTRPLADDLGMEHVLCTRLVVTEQGRFTGAHHDPLCYGAGKVEMAERWAAEHDVDLSRSAFYTDSISDLPMLERVGEPRVVNPDPRLRWVASRRRWKVERW